MPIALPAAALIGGTASLLGASKAASANEDATKAQAQYNQQALAAAQEEENYKRQQVSQYQQRLQPYQQAGQGAASRLDTLLQPSMVGLPGSLNRSAPPAPPVAAPPPAYAPPPVQAAPQQELLVGARKTFPNGKIGVWDGKGYVAQ